MSDRDGGVVVRVHLHLGDVQGLYRINGDAGRNAMVQKDVDAQSG